MLSLVMESSKCYPFKCLTAQGLEALFFSLVRVEKATTKKYQIPTIQIYQRKLLKKTSKPIFIVTSNLNILGTTSRGAYIFFERCAIVSQIKPQN